MKMPITYSLIIAAIMLAAAAALRYADAMHWLGGDGRERGIGVIVGLMLALIANFMPKMLPAHEQSAEGARRTQKVLRRSGWLFTLAGLGYAALSLFAPADIAFPASMALVGGAVVITLGYTLLCAAGASRDAR